MVMGGSLFKPNHDVVVVGHQYLSQEEFIKKTGWEGIKAALSYDNNGNVTPQLSLIGEGTASCGLTGGILGGCAVSREAYLRFLRTNEATAFENPHAARRLMHDRVTLGFGRGFVKYGWRLSVFSGTILILTQAIPAYRGKHSVFDWSAATAFAGMVYKFKQGPKPMVAGMVLGSLLGTTAGILSHGALAIAGLSMEDIYDHKKMQTLRAMQRKQERLRELRKKKKESDAVGGEVE